MGVADWLRRRASQAMRDRDPDDIGGRTKAYLGPEIVVHWLTSAHERTPVIDLFTRLDFELRDRDTNGDQIVFGARFLLDAI